MKKIIFIVTSLFFFSLNSYATHYYVSNTGNDSNSGLVGFPWLTISKVNGFAFAAGDIISFEKGGTWHEALICNRSGSSGNPIIFNSYGSGANPIITGFASITGWTNLGSNIWESTSAVSTLAQLNMVTVGGVAQAQGRYPNLSASTPLGGGWLTYQSFSTSTSITSSSLNSSVTNWTGAEVIIRKFAWVIDRAPITNHSGTTLTYTTGTVGPVYNGVAGAGFFIENDTRTLDSLNEWFYSSTTKKLRIYSTVSPTNVKVSTIDTLVKVQSRSFITFDGIDFTGSNKMTFAVVSANSITIQNCNLDFAGVDCVWGAISATSFIFQSNTVNHTNSNAVILRDFSAPLVQSNTIENTGMQVGMLNRVISGNLYGTGIQSRCNNAIIRYNIIDSSGYAGIKVYNDGFQVEKNFITYPLVTVADGGGIYTWVGSGNTPYTGWRIINNIVLYPIGNNLGTLNVGFPQAQGIYLDDLSANGQIYGNTVAYGSNAGIYCHNTASLYVYNNTLFSNIYGTVLASDDNAVRVRTMTVRQNIFLAATAIQKAIYYRSNFNRADIQAFGSAASIDSNYITRPIGDNLTVFVKEDNATFTDYNLAQWRTFTTPPTFDIHSQKSPVTITNANQLDFEYNATNATVSRTLPPGTWKDVRNVTYSGSTNIAAYSSLVLMSTGSLITPTITWNNPANITYPTALSGVQLNATSGGVPGTFVYTPASGTVLNAGSNILSVTFTPTDQTTYSTATKNVTIVVNKAAATLSYSAPTLTQTYTGSPLSPTIITSPGGLTVVNTTFDGVGAAPTNAGTYALISGLTNTNYAAPNISGSFTINKATATITVSNCNQVYDGSPKPITVTTSPFGLSGITITYNGSTTAPTNAGTYAVAVTLNNQNYTATTINCTLIITKVTPTVSWNPATPITYGTALGGAQLNATASVAGSFSYTPASGTILNAGTQILSVNFTPTDATNYNSVNNTTATIVVSKATATINVSNTTQVYDGTGKSVSVSTTPAGLSGITVLYNGSATPLPVNAGSYSVNVTLTNPNYTATAVNTTLVIQKAEATISINGATLTQVYNGSQRIVTATTIPAGLTVITILYNGSSTAPVNAGSYPIVVSLSNANYQATSANGTLVVAKATPTVNWANPTAITYGTALSGTQLNATASVPGSFAYTPAAGTILNAGVQSLLVNFTPTDATNYNSVLGVSVSITVNKATATITLSNLNQSYDGSPKPVTVTVSPSVGVITVTYNGSSTAPTAVGSYPVVASLSNSNYTATNASGTLIISKATATLALSNLNQTYDGTQKTVTVTTAPAGLTVVSIIYNGSPTAPTNAGSYPIIASLTNANYQATNVSGTLVIAKATPVISWANPAAITYGTALSGTQLNATSGGVSGTFTYTPSAGTVLNAGTQSLSVNFTPTNTTNYNSVNGTSVNIVVNKAVAVITLSNLNQTYDGSPKPVTVSVSPSVGVITTTYNGSNTAPTAVGSYSILSSLSNSNYSATPASGTLVISSSSANIFISNISQTYTGSPLPVTVTTSPPSLPYDITYNGSVTVPTNTGTYTVIATINDGGAHTGADTQTYIINKANPVISWSTPAAITYGTALSGTQLNATASVPGVFTYTPASGAVLNAGTQILSAGFVPTDGSNYNSIPVTTVSLVVNKATATLTLSNLNQTYDGSPKPVTVTTSPVGLGVITVLYDDAATVPSAVGSYGVAASLDNLNYTASPVTGTLVISTASATVTITNINQNYTGSPLPVTVTTNPAGLSYSITYNGSATIPTNSGSYAVVATINDGVHTGSANATLTINKVNPTVTWSTPSPITYGAALSGTELSASASVAGTMTYTPALGTILNAGSQTLSVNFVPADATNYNSVSGVTVTLTVNKAVATLTLDAPTLNQSYDGSQKFVTVTTSPAGLGIISVTYDGSNIAPSAVGSYAINATLNNSNYTATPATGTLVISSTSGGIFISNLNQTYTGGPSPVSVSTNPGGLTYTVTYNGSPSPPINSGSYTVIATITGGVYTGADTQTLVIAKATPVITWANPSAIAFGTALSGTQLNASVNAIGGLTYLPVAGTVLNVGTQNLAVTFTPTDAANYNSVNKIVTIVVNKTTATLTLSNLSQLYDGNPKPVIAGSTPTGLSGITVTYNGSLTPPTNAGSYPIVVSLANDNYQATNVTGTLVIAKATPTLSWTTPAPMQFGTPLSSLQLNATANIAGTFTYSPATGSILNEGTTRVTATFTPADATNYNTATISVSISVFGSPFIQYWIEHGGGTWFENLPGQNLPP